VLGDDRGHSAADGDRFRSVPGDLYDREQAGGCPSSIRRR
jgi:hypothetical protein